MSLKNYMLRFMKVAVLILAAGCFCPNVSAQNPPIYGWVKYSVSPGGYNAIGYGICTDAAGNVYTTGMFGGTNTDFNPGGTAVTITAASSADIFIAKYNSSGNCLWAKGMGSTGVDRGTSIGVDASGNVFVTGKFMGTVDFNPSSTVTNNLVASGNGDDIFIAKYDANGNYIWAKNIGGTGGEEGMSLDIDASGNVWFAGYMGGVAAIDFNAGTGTANLTPVTGKQNGFVAKYDANGNYISAFAIEGRINGMKLDATGNIYTTGIVNSGSADMNPGSGINSVTTPYGSAFIAKYDNNGNYVWANTIAVDNGSYANVIALDPNNNVYIGGNFYWITDFDPGPGTAYDTATADMNAFVAKYDANGNYIWAGGIAGPQYGYSSVTGVAADVDGNAYVTGWFGEGDRADFDPGTDTAYLPMITYSYDVFTAKYGPTGKYLWANTCASTDNTDGGQAITVDANRSIYGTGYVSLGTSNFDPNGVHTITTASQAAYVYKWTQTCAIPVATTQTACDSFIFGGKKLTASGVYKDTFSTITNCDSIVTLTLTINHATINQAITGSYCDSVKFNGVTYKTSGNYTQQYTNVTGCDSSIVLNLTINNSPVATVVKANNTLVTSTPGTYQWVNCDIGFFTAVQGATQQTFTPIQSGNYAVVVTSNSCSDTSVCTYIEASSSVGGPVLAGNNINIYPNPTDGKVTLQTTQPLQGAAIRIVNTIGQAVWQQGNQNGTMFSIDMSAYVPGIYFMEINENGKAIRQKLVKE